jgi:hypothetical protein
MGFLRKAFDFMSSPTHSRTLGILIVIVLVVAVFLTVSVAQQKQTIVQRAESLLNDCRTKYQGECFAGSHCPTGLMQKGQDNESCPTQLEKPKCCVASRIEDYYYPSCGNMQNCNAATTESKCPTGKSKCLSVAEYNNADVYKGQSLVCCPLK